MMAASSSRALRTLASSSRTPFGSLPVPPAEPKALLVDDRAVTALCRLLALGPHRATPHAVGRVGKGEGGEGGETKQNEGQTAWQANQGQNSNEEKQN
ncbi:unnamed protein product [Ixodes pacificus]